MGQKIKTHANAGGSRQRLRLQNDVGFTLIELTVALVIFGILTAIGLPGLIGWLPKYRLDRAVREMNSTIQYARLAAIKYNAEVVVLMDPDGDGSLEGHYIAFIDNGGGDWIRQPDEPVIRKVRVPNGVILTNTTFAGDRFRFNTRGFMNGINGSINLKNVRDATRTITVYVSGNSRIR